MLNAVTKSDIRRHLGYEAHGYSEQAGMFWGLGSNQSQLEVRMTQLQPIDIAKLTGEFVGAVALTGQEPAPGNQVTVMVMSSVFAPPQTVLVTAQSTDTKLSLANKLAQAINQNTVLAGSQIVSMGPVGPASTPEVTVKGPAEFNLSVSSTGNIGAAISLQAQHVEPSAVIGKNMGQAVVKYGYVPILNFLEGAQAGATRNLDMSRAGDFVARPDELDLRRKLYREWQGKLSRFLGIPINAALGGGFQAVI